MMSVIGKPVVVIYLGFDLDAGAELLRPPRGVKTGVPLCRAVFQPALIIWNPF